MNRLPITEETHTVKMLVLGELASAKGMGKTDIRLANSGALRSVDMRTIRAAADELVSTGLVIKLAGRDRETWAFNAR